MFLHDPASKTNHKRVNSHSGTPLGVGTSHGHLDSLDSPRLGLGGSHHLSILYSSLPKAEWTHEFALADLTQRIETELEEKVLKYNLNLKDCFSLEWSWQEEQIRGRMECTILVHISTCTSAISV
jgi:hypothetical protein